MPVYKKKNNDGKKNKNSWFVKVSYKDYYGNTKQKKKEGFSTQSEAKAYERSFLDKAGTSSDMLFSSLYEHYLEHCESRLRPTTYEGKKVLFKLKIIPYFRDMKINEIQPMTVSKWQNELMKESYSDTYLKTIHNQLSAIFNFAMKYYGLKANPARINGSMGKKHAEQMNFYTLDEFYLFINSFEEKPAIKMVFKILFWTGIRSGELLALTQNDFDFKEKTVRISKNYAYHKGQHLILEPKTEKGKRIISLPESLVDDLKDYFSRLPNYDPNDRIFPYSKSLLGLEMKRGANATGLKRIRVHDLRHSHVSLLIEKGFAPLLIAERLGHENIETTLQTYSHLYPNKQSEISSLLQAIYK